MAAKLAGETVMKREIKVWGIDEPVIFTFTSQGVRAHIKGTKTAVETGWVQIVRAMNTPDTVKSYHAGRPYELLQAQALLTGSRREKRIDKKK